MDLNKEILKIAQKAQRASWELGCISPQLKNKALKLMAEALIKNKRYILKQNLTDIRLVEKLKKSKSIIDRLRLDDKRLKLMADSLNEIVHLKDPVGEVIKSNRRPNGLVISKVRIPLGVIVIIYEARPNVTSDCIGLCLKSGNAVILKGGSEAINSNIAIYKVLTQAVKNIGIPDGAINLIKTTNRKAVDTLLKLDHYIDLVIPRGGEGLIRQVSLKSRIPVIKHYKGICHVYVDAQANLDMAFKICFNAKVQRPSVCNAMETLLVHKDIAKKFLPKMIVQFKQAGVEIRGCPITKKIVKGVKRANEADWSTEYLDLILSVKVVKNLDEAIWHINNYGSKHSDAIITDSYLNALEFLKRVDSACVFVNSSTRFSDGYEFGLGAEIGISTDKLHARGPMALKELTTYKYMVFGDGQIRK